MIIFAGLILGSILSWAKLIPLSLSNQNLEIMMLNIGQGDSILIKTPYNRFGLIDAGRSDAVLNELAVNLPYLVTEFEFGLITHIDTDHAEGFLTLLKVYKFKKIFINRLYEKNNLYTELIKEIQNRNIPIFELNIENDFKIGEVFFDVIWPNPQAKLENTNDASIALLISYKNLEFFTGGDLPSEYELEALNNTNYFDIDILKVGHHGSNTSTSEEFLAKTTPLISLISVGANNNYGHPTQQVLEHLSNYNTLTYRTDVNGTISLKSNGVMLYYPEGFLVLK